MDTKDAGKLGGEKRAAKLTPKQRSDSAKKASLARWAKAKAKSAVAPQAKPKKKKP